MSVLFGKTNENTVRILHRTGAEVHTPPDQICCGALFLHGGALEKAKECARHNIDVFEKQNLDAIIINAAGCGSTLKEYGKLLHDDPQYAARATAFSKKVKDLSEWLANSKPSARSGRDLASEGGDARVTYHDACHLAHPQGIKAQPRSLVRSVAGIEYVELAEADVCCGSAGSYNLTEPEMADQLQRRKVANIRKTGAHVVVTTNPGCILQIQAGLKKDGANVKVMHLADFLEETNKNA